MNLYPLKFHPIFVDKLWGGKRLKEVLNKDCSDRCGESWEISAVKDSVSVVANGSLAGQDLQALIDTYQEKLLGTKVFRVYGREFPLLIKFLDANDDLSVQVHPNDEQALKKHGTRGKTEMWYVMDAEKGAKLIAGLKPEIDRDSYIKLFQSGNVMDTLNQVEVDKGDTFFIPAGKVHTIGKGILIAEIQETSDITYRIYDFDRVDINGNKRDLHVQDALEVINFNEINTNPKISYDQESSYENLASCDHFTTNRILLNEPLAVDYTDKDSFVAHICTAGNLLFKTDSDEVSLSKGESLLIPASLNHVELVPVKDAELLEVYID